MDLAKSHKLASFRAEYFEHAKQHLLFQNTLDSSGHIVFGRGCDNPSVVFIGEAPGQQENKSGKPFTGRSGKILDLWISELNVKKFTIINVVPIIPLKEGSIRKPTKEEIAYFLPLTEKYLELLNPKVIVLLGKSAASIFDKNLELGEIRSWKKTKLFFIYHPSYYLRKGGKGFEKTLSKLKDFLDNKDKQLNMDHF
jgi:uracil-DNA glycosylase